MLEFFDDDPLFQMFTDRAIALVARGAAEMGECSATARRIEPGDRDGWYGQWTALARRLAETAGESAAAGRWTSAADGYQRAATYFRTAYQPLFGEPVDPRLTEAFDLESDCFGSFAALAPQPVEAVEIPFEGTTLPGHLCLPADADPAGPPLPTVVSVNGYDSNVHEAYAMHAVPAVRRGYACLLVDGPGQGSVLIRQGLRLRPDWETVLRPVIDYAAGRSEVDAGRIAVMGMSLGGFLAPRGVSGDGRVAALIADPGMWDLLAGMGLPPDVMDRLPDVDPDELSALVAPAAESPMGRWRLVQRGLWTHGVQSLGAYIIELSRYTLSDVAGRIACPALVVANESDPLSAHAQLLHDAVAGPKALVRLGGEDGAFGHCQIWNRSVFDRCAFDWLDGILSPESAA
ncbi:CocE/NonD family hydrolase [Streptomyces sp. HNM0663]|uniref:CocE/NonD family hydrolase n=1 Tax=Streptomyces chengmaiensis TaxID=3040919 RepID=A0ABT6HMA6_9ACTN|nr:CocE/NonD family hydrolase [Streptomyces chengmaiensis]MDH2389014.1 CocE/NonD family hydrolase [Streptomyces chengmaiensis]